MTPDEREDAELEDWKSWLAGMAAIIVVVAALLSLAMCQG